MHGWRVQGEKENQTASPNISGASNGNQHQVKRKIEFSREKKTKRREIKTHVKIHSGSKRLNDYFKREEKYTWKRREEQKKETKTKSTWNRKTMGSLPNLNELCQEKIQRRSTAERERDAARERAQQLEFISRDYKNNRTKDQLPTLFQVRFNILMVKSWKEQKATSFTLFFARTFIFWDKIYPEISMIYKS